MKKSDYSDKELKDNIQSFFLGTAGFVIEIVLEPTEQVFFKRKLIEDLKQIWGKGGFFQRRAKNIDFEVKFTSGENHMELFQKEKGKHHYYLTSKRDFSSHKIKTFYHIGLLVFQIILKEILTFLVAKDGFLLHASGCWDKKGDLKIFMASSGGGKTTIANLLTGKKWSKFSDDALIVRRIDKKWVFFSPPFVEKERLPVNKKFSKAEIFFIKKAKKPARLELSDENETLRLVLQQIWLKTKELDRKTLANVMIFVKENRFYRLETILDEEKMRKLL